MQCTARGPDWTEEERGLDPPFELEKPERRQATDGKKKVRGAMDFFPVSFSLSLSLLQVKKKLRRKKEKA